jgi:DNA-binding transcriptional LysR family regulator
VVARLGSVSLPGDVVGEPLYAGELRVVAGASSPFVRRRRIALAELARATWILSRNELGPATPVVEAFEAAQLAMPQRLIVSGSLSLRYNLLSSGAMVTVIPESLLRYNRHPAVAHELPVPLPVWRIPVMVLTLRGRPLAPAAHLLVDTIRGLARAL